MPKVILDKNKNQVFIGSPDNKLIEWDSEALIRIKLLIKNYLELDNVSFLFGAGSSIHLGCKPISRIPKEIENEVSDIPKSESSDKKSIEIFENILKKLQGKDELERTKGEINYPLEDLLNYLNALLFVSDLETNYSKNIISNIISAIKRKLFAMCDIDIQIPLNRAKNEENKNIQSNKYFYHEKLVKKILQRPLNLRRSNIFTTNYDLAFDNAFNNIGVFSIDGFTGFHNRVFRPETYEYDIYFPGSTTQGKVNRIEKVLKYYKLHGSLTWIRIEPSAQNIFGMKELPLELIKKNDIYDELMIYPSATKKSYTLEFPYSELFRHFASSITQQQSVLFTFGFSFSDEHISDIIYQALSIPSFTLIIIDYLGTSKGIEKLKKLNDPRIIILRGEQLGDFIFFSEEVMPDLIDIDVEQKIALSMKKLYGKNQESTEDDNKSFEINVIDSPEVIQDKENDIDDLPF